MNCGLIESWFILHIEDLLQGSIKENIDKRVLWLEGNNKLIYSTLS